VAQRTLEAAPSDVLAFLQAYRALTELERRDEAVRLAEARLQRLPEDGVALEVLASAATARGDVAAAQAYRRRVVDAAKADAATYNNLAWGALLLGKVDAAALEDAQRAASLSSYTQAHVLHTLAALYAEVGKGPEARQLLLKSLELRGTDALEPHDWYVVGRIAEGYGLTDTARAAYARARTPKPSPDSVDGLAEAHLQALGPARTASPTP
jgi:tetratricopeptide (TPR) repeat protein